MKYNFVIKLVIFFTLKLILLKVKKCYVIEWNQNEMPFRYLQT